jgi:hypothetical protein
LLRHKNIRTTVRYTNVGYEQTRQTAEAAQPGFGVKTERSSSDRVMASECFLRLRFCNQGGLVLHLSKMLLK